MANSELYGNEYEIPIKILNSINKALYVYPSGDGIKRAKFLLNNKKITYQSLKRLKNFFDYYDSNKNDKGQYELAGGDLMRSFVNTTLDNERNAVDTSKSIRDEIDNNTSVNDVNNIVRKQSVNEGSINDGDVKNKCVVAVILNFENKIFLGKRNESMDYGAGKWALIGGYLKDDENEKETCVREIFEETGLKINNVKKIITNVKQDIVEFVYYCQYNGSDDAIRLNSEHSEFGWFGIDEIQGLDVVNDAYGYFKIVLETIN